MFGRILNTPLFYLNNVRPYRNNYVFSGHAASIFNTPIHGFFGLNHRVKFFYVIRKFLPEKVFGNYLNLLHSSYLIV